MMPQQKYRHAFTLWETIKTQKNFQINSNIIETLIVSAWKLKKSKEVINIMTYSLSKGVPPTEYSGFLYMRACSTSTDTKDISWLKAVEMMAVLRENTCDIQPAYEEAIVTCSNAGKWRTSIDLLNQMLSKPYLPTYRLLSSSLMGCCQSNQPAPHMAYNVFKYMMKHSFTCKEPLYATLLQALCKANLHQEYEIVWNQLLVDKLTITPALAYSRIEQLAASDQLTAAEQVLDETLKKGYSPHMSYAAMLKGVMKSNKLQDTADSLLRRMSHHHTSPPPQLLGDILLRLVQHNLVDDAISLYEGLLACHKKGKSTSNNNDKENKEKNKNKEIVKESTTNTNTTNTTPSSPTALPSFQLQLPRSAWINILKDLISRQQWKLADKIKEVWLRHQGDHSSSTSSSSSNSSSISCSWICELMEDLGNQVDGGRLPLLLADWANESSVIDIELALIQALCKTSAGADAALMRHCNILYGLPHPSSFVLEETGFDDTAYCEDRLPCDYSEEITMRLLTSLCDNNEWTTVYELIDQLASYDPTLPHAMRIQAILPQLFSKAISYAKTSSEGVGETTDLLLKQRELSVPMTWSCCKNAMRALFEEYRWEEVIQLFSSRYTYRGYQPAHESSYRIAIRSCAANNNWPLALHLLFDFVDEARGIMDETARNHHSSVSNAIVSTEDTATMKSTVANIDMKKKDGSSTTIATGTSTTSNLPMGPSLFGLMILILVKNNQAALAFEVINQMKKLGIKPTIESMKPALQSANHATRNVLTRELMRAGMPVVTDNKSRNSKLRQFRKNAAIKRKRKEAASSNPSCA